MLTIMNKLVASVLFSPVPTTVVASSMPTSLFRTILFGHDNHVVTALFNQQ